MTKRFIGEFPFAKRITRVLPKCPISISLEIDVELTVYDFQSLEKVLVQNVLFGLSPPLTEAIRSVPRWRFVQAAFPHVMHCASTLLYNRSVGQ